MLKELLQECHMTQETVAEQAAMHRSTVARIINVPEAASADDYAVCRNFRSFEKSCDAVVLFGSMPAG